MHKHTTIKIGGPARFFVTPRDRNVLVRLVGALDYIKQPFRIIGSGSNLIVPDAGYDGVIIKSASHEIVQNGDFIYADAGVTLTAVRNFARDRALSGLEFCAGIPGTVGGAVCMNAGACGGTMSGVVAMVDVLIDGEIMSMDNLACKFAYRSSIFQKPHGANKERPIILGAYFFLQHTSIEQITETEQKYIVERKNRQPKEPSAGSVFRNPDSDTSAGALIDSAGLRGFSVRGAAVSDVHANFIVNRGGATARDVKKIVKHIQGCVFGAFGVRLKTEIEFLQTKKVK